ncbi:putative purple acid phosphatase 2-like [Capsicum annuum]|nr:putative purple acid phosphatase 2-like [Capsicum annuum]
MEPMLLPNKRFKNQNLCVHPFCTDCIIKYITIKLDDKIRNTPCPYPNCNHFIDPMYCQNLLGDKLFVKWCDMLCVSDVLEFPHCYCPNWRCFLLVVDECSDGIAARSKCPSCKNLFRYKCNTPWHGVGVRCIGNGRLEDQKKSISWLSNLNPSRVREEVAFRKLAMHKKWKRCPWCGHVVELVRGCKIVTCRCHGSFCYKCGRQVCGQGCECDSWDCGLYMVAYVECLTFDEGVSSVGFDPDLIRRRYASLLWDYGSRKEEAKTQSDDEAPMRTPRKIGITEDIEVHDL